MPSRLPLGQACDRSKPLLVNPASGSTEPHTLRPGPRQPRSDPLLNPGLFKFSQCSQDMQLQLTRRRGAVDAFTEADEGDAEGLEFLNERHKVLQVATESV